MKRALALGFGLALVAAAPAQAAEHVINGQATLSWDRPDIAVAVGDTVTWQFPDTSQNHNVQSQAPNPADPAWTDFKSAIGMPAPPKSYTFNAAGDYAYVCIVHSGMTGVVRVGSAGPPPPPPLSAQPLVNDDASVVPLEKVIEDKAKPKLSSVSARRAGSAVRVRFKVSEQSRVQVRIKRGGKTIKTASAEGTGTRSISVRGLRAGRYSVEVRATDVAGNRARLKKTSVTVR